MRAYTPGTLFPNASRRLALRGTVIGKGNIGAEDGIMAIFDGVRTLMDRPRQASSGSSKHISSHLSPIYLGLLSRLCLLLPNKFPELRPFLAVFNYTFLPISTK